MRILEIVALTATTPGENFTDKTTTSILTIFLYLLFGKSTLYYSSQGNAYMFRKCENVKLTHDEQK